MLSDDPLKYWESEGKNKDGLHQLKLEPELELLGQEELTLDVVTRLCACLQIDADKVLFSDEQVELPENPPLTHVDEFFSILVKNYDQYDIEEMPASQVKMLVGGLAAYFIKASSQK